MNRRQFIISSASVAWSTNFGDEKVWARYLGPGHTSGDAVIHFEKALPQFESVTAFNPRLTLEGTLGSIYDELSK